MGMIWLPFGLTPTPKKEDGPRYADIYARGIAAAVDAFLIFFPLEAVFRRIGREIYQNVNPEVVARAQSAKTLSELVRILWETALLHVWLLNCAVQVFLIGVIIVSVQWIWGTTPGKKLMGIRIVHAKTLSDPAHWRYVVRFLGYIPACLPLMLGVIWVSFNKQRRGWHDYLAGTAVIHNKPAGWWWDALKRLFKKYVRKSPATEAAPE